MATIYRNTINDNGTVTTVELSDAGVITTTGPAGAVVTQADAETLAYYTDAYQARQRRERLSAATATLRQWSAEAETTNVGPMTVAQHKAVTQTVVNRLGVFFDRFADLLDERN